MREFLAGKPRNHKNCSVFEATQRGHFLQTLSFLFFSTKSSTGAGHFGCLGEGKGVLVQHISSTVDFICK